MSHKQIRNIAIIAHVDHGKTTMVDQLLRQSGTLDIRKNTDWLIDSLALTSAEDRQALIKKRMPETWKGLAKFKERIIRLDDTRESQLPPLAEVKQQIQQKLGQGKIAKFRDDIRAKYKTDYKFTN